MSGNENDQPAEYWWGDGLAVTPRLLSRMLVSSSAGMDILVFIVVMVGLQTPLLLEILQARNGTTTIIPLRSEESHLPTSARVADASNLAIFFFSISPIDVKMSFRRRYAFLLIVLAPPLDLPACFARHFIIFVVKPQLPTSQASKATMSLLSVTDLINILFVDVADAPSGDDDGVAVTTEQQGGAGATIVLPSAGE